MGDKIFKDYHNVDIVINNVMIGDYEKELSGKNKIVGSIICKPNKESSSIDHNTIKLIQDKFVKDKTHLILIFNYDDQSILLATNNLESNIEITDNKNITKLNITELVEWTRKRK